MTEEEELNSMMSEMQDLEIVRNLLSEVIDLKEYTSRLSEAQDAEFMSHVNAVQEYSKKGDQAHIKYHLTCARRLLESARDWEV